MPGSWRRRVGEAQAALRAGRLHKVVLARAARFEAEAPVPWPALAEGLRSSQEGCLVYSFAAPEGSAFVGATPELLVRRSGRRAWSCALAGSAPRSCRQAEDRRFAEQLARSAKEQGEHAFVAEAVCDALRAAGAVTEIGRPAVVQLAHVQHIETRIEAELRADTHILELAGRLHPTPAVAGAPRSAALEFLERHEPLDRGWYSGAAGWVEAGGDGELSVALRCARVEGTRLWAYAGAGIVEASEAESEWAETEIKLRAIVSLLKVQP
jgi:isochorismate synthase